MRGQRQEQSISHLVSHDKTAAQIQAKTPQEEQYKLAILQLKSFNIFLNSAVLVPFFCSQTLQLNRSSYNPLNNKDSKSSQCALFDIIVRLLYCQIKQCVMLNKKKTSNISEPTQAERPKRFIRRNSIHTLHCRSGSLNKLASFSQELNISQPQLHTDCNQPRKRCEIDQLNPEQISLQFQECGHHTAKRGSGSMKVKGCCKEKSKLVEQFDLLKKKYEQRGKQLVELELECRSSNNKLNEELHRRKKLQDDLRLNKQELKRVEKRLEKYKAQRDQWQEEKERMLSHIHIIESTHFTPSLLTVQNYREQVLEQQLKKVKVLLQKSREQRESQLMGEIDKLGQQKYQLEMVNKRSEIANKMLSRQLEQSEQYLAQMREGMTQAITSSAEYIELRDRYRRTLVEMRELRAEVIKLEGDGSSILSASLLSISQSINPQQS